MDDFLRGVIAELSKMLDQPHEEEITNLYAESARREQRIKALEKKVQLAEYKHRDDAETIRRLESKIAKMETVTTYVSPVQHTQNTFCLIDDDESDYIEIYTPDTTLSHENSFCETDSAPQTPKVMPEEEKLPIPVLNPRQRSDIEGKCVSIPFILDNTVTPLRREHMLMTMSEFKRKFTVLSESPNADEVTLVEEKVWANEYDTMQEFSQDFIDNLLQDFLDGRTDEAGYRKMIDWFCAELSRMPPVKMLETWY